MSGAPMTEFFCPGEIQPWERTTGGRHKPKATRAFQGKVRMFAKAAGAKCIPSGAAVSMYLEILVPKPKHSRHDFPTAFDSSNVLKSVEDALNKVAYDDDRQITRTTVVKRFTVGREEPGVFVRVGGSI